MPLPPFESARIVPATDRHRSLCLTGKSFPGREYRYVLTPAPGGGRTSLGFSVSLDGDEPVGSVATLLVHPPYLGTGMGRHLVATALGLLPACRTWHIRDIVGDGVTFWPHLCPQLAREFDVAFHLHPMVPLTSASGAWPRAASQPAAGVARCA